MSTFTINGKTHTFNGDAETPLLKAAATRGV